jgi:FkbM family methyltransferase
MMCRENLKYWESSSREIFSILSLTSKCAVDIGSYTGVYTLVAAKTNKKILTISFEPNPDLYAALEKNVQINRLKNFKLAQVALDKEIGSAILYLNHDQHTSVGSLIKLSSAGKQIKVNRTTLDSYCQENKVDFIDLMKIDVEGSEVTLEKYSPLILMEALTVSSLESQYIYLKQFGYLRPMQVKGDGFDNNNWLWFTEKNSAQVNQVLHLLEV